VWASLRSMRHRRVLGLKRAPLALARGDERVLGSIDLDGDQGVGLFLYPHMVDHELDGGQAFVAVGADAVADAHQAVAVLAAELDGAWRVDLHGLRDGP
jgi:hypothetical protein